MDIAAPTLIPNLRECAILLDVDGTILDLAPTPREVWVPPSLRLTIAQLSESTGGALALVSGRSTVLPSAPTWRMPRVTLEFCLCQLLLRDGSRCSTSVLNSPRSARKPCGRLARWASHRS